MSRAIKSLAAYVEEISLIAKSWSPRSDRTPLWFRGQAHNWKLRPSLYRRDGWDVYPHDVEKHYRSEFRTRGPQITATEKPVDPWEWYFIMQHFGFPTRLIDWSDSALIALYFAVRDRDATHSPVVWVLDPVWLNEISCGISNVASPEWIDVSKYLPDQETDLPRNPLAIDPGHVTRRLSAQRGHFTVHGILSHPLDEIARKLAKGPILRLKRLSIHRRYKADIEYELACCGITETSIYPDFEGLSREFLKELT